MNVKKILIGAAAAAAMLLMAMPAMAAKPSANTNGFDEFGYNYQSRMFVGKADGVDRLLDNAIWGDSTYANDHLVMKWSKAWDDARFHGVAWTPEAYEDNEWNGMLPDGSKTTEHTKIIWVGSAKWDVSGSYTMDLIYSGSHYLYSLILSQSGNSVTGKLNDPYLPGELNIINGVVNGNQISFAVEYPTNYQGVRTFTGTIGTSGTLSGNWTETGSENGADTWSITTGLAILNNGPYWREGGTRIWNDFEVIFDQGMTGGMHNWWTHAMPSGYGAL